jgi:hypothetical protein
MTYDVLSASALGMFSLGLAVAFLIIIGFIVRLFRASNIDHRLLSLMFLFCLMFFLIAFSFLLAGAVPGYHIKIAVAVVDSTVFLGSMFLSRTLIPYLGLQQ